MLRVTIRVLTCLALISPVAVTMAWAQVGDPVAGQEKAAVCAACHGMDGNSQVTIWPKIAGQHADYIARQTRMVRDGQRNVPTMMPMVMNLSDQDIADIAAWYAQQTVQSGVADEELVALGSTLYHGGNHATGLPACMACHGPSGYGIPMTGYPKLTGQHADYTADRLRRYRSGETNGDDDPNSQMMVEIAAKLSDDEIEALSSYIEGLHRVQ